MSTTKVPKRRQTCDPCRKAKIKCDKRTPICGRCLATGDLCGYGISRQGAWWRNKGRKQSDQLADDEGMDVLRSLTLSNAFPGSILSQPPSLISSSVASTSSECHDIDQQYELPQGLETRQDDSKSIFPADFSFGQSEQDIPSQRDLYSGNIESPIEYRNSFDWFSMPDYQNFLIGEETDPANFKPHLTATKRLNTPVDFQPSSSSGATCSCFGSILETLQHLDQWSKPLRDETSRSSMLGFATILQTSERTIERCWSVLRCPICSRDHSKTPFSLVFALLKRQIELIEQWISLDSTTAAPNTPSGTVTDDRSLKVEVAQASNRRLFEILEALRLVSRNIFCDYARTAYEYLGQSLVDLLLRLTEKLNAETNGSVLEVVRTLEHVRVQGEVPFPSV